MKKNKKIGFNIKKIIQYSKILIGKNKILKIIALYYHIYNNFCLDQLYLL